MQISAPATNISSIQSAITTATMRSAMNQDAKSVMGLLEGMEEMTAEIEQLQNQATGQGTKAVEVDFRI